MVDLLSWRSTNSTAELELRWNPADLGSYSGNLSLKLMVYHENATVGS